MKVTKDVEIWQKIRTEEEVIGEYKYGSYICPEFAFLWNEEFTNKKAGRILKILVDIKSKKKRVRKKK